MLKILVGVDGSNGSLNAVNSACLLAKLTGASVTFIHVVAIPVRKLNPNQIEVIKTKLANKILEPAEAIAKQENINYFSDILFCEEVIDGLIKESNKGYWIIAVGRRGLSGLEKLILGSVSQSLVERAACNVLVAVR